MPRSKPQTRTIDTIKATLMSPALTSYFDVEIGLPEGPMRSKLTSLLGGQQDRLNIMCSDVSLPGSSLATLELTNDRPGVTEKHAYRRIFEDRIDLTFYVDANGYLPIKFFETWMSEIMNEDPDDARNSNYFYRSKYPDEYMASQGLKVIKFERDQNRSIEYEFFRTFPLSINSMPISYEASSLLKCNVSMSYIRYVLAKPDSPTTQQPSIGGNTLNDLANFNSRNQGFNAGQLPARVNDFTEAVQNNGLPLGANDQLRSIASGLA